MNSAENQNSKSDSQILTSIKALMALKIILRNKFNSDLVASRVFET